MKKNLIFLLLCCCLSPHLHTFGQFNHFDFIGAGHDNGITVTSSSSNNNSGQKTVDGFPIQNTDQLKDASRFLAQATFGADMPTIRMTAAMGYEAWLQEQFQLPQVSVLTEMNNHNQLYEEFDPGDDIPGIGSHFFRSTWLTNNLTSPDVLRQRIAFVLSQIYVINDGTDFFADFGQSLGAFYDMLLENSFGNYQKLLTDVTFSPAMGFFLSHYDNPKADLANNIHPDENYAREIMQLFSIGLWELNTNGTRKYDANGQFIPTYSNADIKEFAQVFTGLSDGRTNGQFGGFDILDDGELVGVLTNPMKMYDNHHDKSEKHLLNGVVLPANQSGMDDLDQTMAHLSNHPNTAPFICKSLIRFLTTSNPSPTYVQDVVATFNPTQENNFQVVISAILLHPEARNCTPTATYTFGKLREPLIRYLNFLKAFHVTANENGDYLNEMLCLRNNVGQAPLQAPSVFNFFLPEYAPQGPINQNYLVAPEFQILNASNAIGIVNDANMAIIQRQYFGDICQQDYEENASTGEEEGYFMDYSAAIALADDATALVNYLDILLANGLLEDDTKMIIVDAINQLNDPQEKIRMALFLILISPDYAILK